MSSLANMRIALVAAAVLLPAAARSSPSSPLPASWEIAGQAGPVTPYRFEEDRGLPWASLMSMRMGRMKSREWAAYAFGATEKFISRPSYWSSYGEGYELSTRVSVVGVGLERRVRSSEPWIIRLGAGPALARFDWSGRVLSYRTVLGEYKRNDVVPAAEILLGLRRPVTGRLFLDVECRYLITADLSSKRFENIDRGFRGLRQGAFQMGLGMDLGGATR